MNSMDTIGFLTQNPTLGQTDTPHCRWSGPPRPPYNRAQPAPIGPESLEQKVCFQLASDSQREEAGSG